MLVETIGSINELRQDLGAMGWHNEQLPAVSGVAINQIRRAKMADLYCGQIELAAQPAPVVAKIGHYIGQSRELDRDSGAYSLAAHIGSLAAVAAGDLVGGAA